METLTLEYLFMEPKGIFAIYLNQLWLGEIAFRYKGVDPTNPFQRKEWEKLNVKSQLVHSEMKAQGSHAVY